MKFGPIFTTLIAVTALVVSGIHVYVEFFHERHDFSAAISTTGVPKDHADLVFINAGNVHELILNATYTYSTTPDGDYDQTLGGGTGALVLAPGETLVRRISQPLEATVLRNPKFQANGGKTTTKLGVRVTLVGQDGAPVERICNVGDLEIGGMEVKVVQTNGGLVSTSLSD